MTLKLYSVTFDCGRAGSGEMYVAAETVDDALREFKYQNDNDRRGEATGIKMLATEVIVEGVRP